MKPGRVPLSARASAFLFIIAAISAVAVAAVGAYDLGPAYSYIHSYTPAYLYSVVTQFTVYLSWIIILAAVLYISYLIIYGKKSLLRGDTEGRNANRSYATYLAAFALLDLFLSEIEAIAGVSPSSLGMPDSSAIVVYGFSAVLFSLVMQLVAVYPVAYIFRNLEARGIIQNNPQMRKWRNLEIVLTASAIDLVLGYIVPLVGPDSISMLLTVMVLNYICLRSGFTRSLLAYFISTMFSVTSFIVLDNLLFSVLLTVFLLIWAFVGFAWVTSIMMASTMKPRLPENREEIAKRYIDGTDYSKLWVRSTCPNCGESKFHLEPDGSLKCDKCNEILEKDAEGKLNIIIQTKKVI